MQPTLNNTTPVFSIFKKGTTLDGPVIIRKPNDEPYDVDAKIKFYEGLGYKVERITTRGIHELNDAEKQALAADLDKAVVAVNEINYDGLSESAARSKYRKAMKAGRIEVFAKHNVQLPKLYS